MTDDAYQSYLAELMQKPPALLVTKIKRLEAEVEKKQKIINSKCAVIDALGRQVAELQIELADAKGNLPW